MKIINTNKTNKFIEYFNYYIKNYYWDYNPGIMSFNIDDIIRKYIFDWDGEWNKEIREDGKEKLKHLSPTEINELIKDLEKILNDKI